MTYQLYVLQDYNYYLLLNEIRYAERHVEINLAS